MPVEKKLIAEGPRPSRNKKSVLESTQEWLDMKTLLSEGLKPLEAVYIRFSPAQLQELKLKHLGRAFRDRAREYIEERGLSYDVERFQSDGTEIIRITGRAVYAPQGAFEQTPSRTAHASHKQVGKKKRVA